MAKLRLNGEDGRHSWRKDGSELSTFSNLFESTKPGWQRPSTTTSGRTSIATSPPSVLPIEAASSANRTIEAPQEPP